METELTRVALGLGGRAVFSGQGSGTSLAPLKEKEAATNLDDQKVLGVAGFTSLERGLPPASRATRRITHVHLSMGHLSPLPKSLQRVRSSERERLRIPSKHPSRKSSLTAIVPHGGTRARGVLRLTALSVKS